MQPKYKMDPVIFLWLTSRAEAGRVSSLCHCLLNGHQFSGFYSVCMCCGIEKDGE